MFAEIILKFVCKFGRSDVFWIRQEEFILKFFSSSLRDEGVLFREVDCRFLDASTHEVKLSDSYKYI